MVPHLCDASTFRLCWKMESAISERLSARTQCDGRANNRPSRPLLRYVSLHALPINVLHESRREPGETLRAFVTALSRSALSYLLAFPVALDYTLPA
jgi:hypothetical protein